MRIISGLFKNQRLIEPRSFHSKPMSERSRAALLNTLGGIEGKTVLDTFAGTGAVGLEMLSRGAACADFVERDGDAFAAIQENIENSKSERAHAYKMSVAAFRGTFPEKRYDIVFADPPYNAIQEQYIEKAAGAVDEDGLFVVSLPEDYEDLEIEGFRLIKVAQYSKVSLRYYRRK